MAPAPGRPWLWASCAAALVGAVVVLALWWEYRIPGLGSLTWSLPFFLAGLLLGLRGLRLGGPPPVWWLAGIGVSIVGILYWLLTLLVVMLFALSFE